MLAAAMAISLVCFVILRLCFPTPDFFIDSTNYVNWAYYDVALNYRPVGYSKFLRLVHEYVSGSIVAVAAVQYLLFLVSTLFCFFSIDHLFHLQKKVRWVVFILLVFNPVLIFQTNLISSDGVFCSLTVLWFTSCLWIASRQQWWALLAQVGLLYMCFAVRYTALFYPVIAVLVFVLCARKLLYRITGIVLTIYVMMHAVEKQENLMKEQTGVKVFSGFSGWQLANNVLYYHKKIKVDTADLYSPEMKAIYNVVNVFIDSVDRKDSVGCVYMWDKKSPLKVLAYMRMYSAKQAYFPSWVYTSVYFGEYAGIIIKQQPWAYVRYFMLPNAKEYFYPPLEVVGSYNSTSCVLDTITMKWYGIKDSTLTCRAPGVQRYTMSVYPAVTLLLHLASLFATCIFLVRAVRARHTIGRDVVAMFVAWFMFYFGYMGFSIIAAPVYMRLVDPVYILCIVMPAALLSFRPRPE